MNDGWMDYSFSTCISSDFLLIIRASELQVVNMMAKTSIDKNIPIRQGWEKLIPICRNLAKYKLNKLANCAVNSSKDPHIHKGNNRFKIE